MKRIIASIMLFMGIVAGYGAGFAPVKNYTRQAYGAGSQNWAMTQDEAGRVYFANRDGLLKFDGTRWSLYHLPNYTTVRAVMADKENGRIYVGGSGEFGYFHSDPATRRLAYESLSAALPDGGKDFTEIWHIHQMQENLIAFQGDYKIFLANGKKISIIRAPEKLTTSANIEGTLYAGSQSGGLYVVSGSILTRLPFEAARSRIVGILPTGGKDLLIVTATDGLYTYSEGKATPIEADFNRFLKENQAFSATGNGQLYVVGTVNDGAVVWSAATGETSYINRDTGLQNNTVLGLGFDMADNLWLCLDNGLSVAMVNSPVHNLLGDSSDSGAGYSSLRSGDRLYLATNRGLFTTPYPFARMDTPPALERLLSGQVWGIDTIGPTIFISADNGLYTMQQGSTGTVERMPGMEGNWFVAPLRARPGFAVASSYQGFHLLKDTGGRWENIGKIEGYDDAGGKFLEDDQGRLWLSHWIKGIYRLELSDDLLHFRKIRLYTECDGLPGNRDNTVTLHNGEILISGASGTFYRPIPDGTLAQEESLTRELRLHNPVHLYELPGGTEMAVSPNLIWRINRDIHGNTRIDSVSLRMLARSIIPGFEHIGYLDGENMIVSHQEGFYVVDIARQPSGSWRNGVIIESLASGDSVIFSGLMGKDMPEIRLPYNLNSLTFSFAAPEYRFDEGILYSCLLEGYDKEWSSPSGQAIKEYTQLREGKYTMRVRAVNALTGDTSETSLTFTVAPPWYRSLWAWIVYALLMAGALAGIFLIVRWLSERNAAKMQRQKDYEIASLKSDRLELDIKHKSSELSNTTMNVIRKNEILMDISGMLDKMAETAETEENPKVKKEIEKIQKLIKDNISHDDDWKKFNQNFDIVYADFTRHLSELHPDLTHAEKRLCCYLKMGLQSKDIAPIFSISPKSVEMNRYRLRKKLGLSRENNLVDYLQKI